MGSAKTAGTQFVSGYLVDGRYELLYPYAQGGMATVWLARITGKHGFEKLVAVKTILSHLANEPGFRSMFLDEASIAARIRHPNVADIVDLGEDQGVLYMVLEWVSGDSWAKLHAGAQKGGGFPLHLLLRIAADACAGLHAAHELRDEHGAPLGVVHRDISPQNVLISSLGVTKVIDFGIAKAMDRMSETTKTGMLKGKAQYSAPEQIRSKAVDRRADVWAIGTILYHYLSGKLPYEGKNEFATLKNLASGKPPPPLSPAVPPGIAAVVMKALTPDPAGRFQTALEMERAIEAVLPMPTTTPDVAAFLCETLKERLETKRRDLADAIAEADQRRPHAAPRGRLGSYPELAPPPIVAQVLGLASPPAQPGTAGSSAAPPAEGAASAAPPREVAAPVTSEPSLTRDIATRLRPGLSDLRITHWIIMAGGAVLPILVWGLVAYVAVYGPLGHAPR